LDRARLFLAFDENGWHGKIAWKTENNLSACQ
jgi:hypothetical protein